MGMGAVQNLVGTEQQYPQGPDAIGGGQLTLVKAISSLENSPVNYSEKPVGAINKSSPPRVYQDTLRPVAKKTPETTNEWQDLVNSIARRYRNIQSNSGNYKDCAKIPPCNVTGDTALKMINCLGKFIYSQKKPKLIAQTLHVEEHRDAIKKMEAKKSSVNAINKIVTEHVRVENGVYKSYSRNILDFLERFFSDKYKQTIKDIKTKHGTTHKDKILANLNNEITKLSMESDSLRDKLRQVNKEIYSYSQDLKTLHYAKVYFSTSPE